MGDPDIIGSLSPLFLRPPPRPLKIVEFASDNLCWAPPVGGPPISSNLTAGDPTAIGSSELIGDVKDERFNGDPLIPPLLILLTAFSVLNCLTCFRK